jgi:uncharacterized protein YdiU (UPF0061 family)
VLSVPGLTASPCRAQPEICRWNCEKLAEAVAWGLPKKVAEQELAVFDAEYDRWVMDSILVSRRYSTKEKN